MTGMGLWRGIRVLMAAWVCGAVARAGEFSPDIVLPPTWLHQARLYDARAQLSDLMAARSFAARTRHATKPLRAVVAKPQPVAQTAPNAPDGLLDWRDSHVRVAVAGPKGGASDLHEGAQVKLDLPALSLDAAVSAEVGKDPNQAAMWHKRSAKLDMDVRLVPKTKVRLTGAQDYALRYREASGIGAGRGKPHVLDSEHGQARIAATVSPLSGMTLTLGAAGSGKLTRDATAGSKTGPNSAVETDDREVFASLAWKPLSWLGLEADAREKTDAIAWRAQNATSIKSGEAQSFAPKLTMQMSFAGAEWQASVERASAGYDAGAFVAYASRATKTEAVRVKPDGAWTYRAEVKRPLGPAAITASYTAARAGSVTEYGFSAAKAQVPVSTALMARDAVDVALSMPLRAFGLDDARVEGRAAWRDSQVRDPLSQTPRRASGETPASLTVKLEQGLPAEGVRLGIEGVLNQGYLTYQTKQITEVTGGGRLGAYLAYAPGDYELRLDMDGLIATSENIDYLYQGSRIRLQEPAMAVRPDAGPLVRLSLRRAL